MLVSPFEKKKGNRKGLGCKHVIFGKKTPLEMTVKRFSLATCRLEEALVHTRYFRLLTDALVHRLAESLALIGAHMRYMMNVPLLLIAAC